MKKIVFALLVATLAGCAPVVRMSTPRTVMIGNAITYNSAEALRLAEAECMKYNRHAVHVPDNMRDGNASYECKD